MSSDHSTLESDLRSLSPAELDPALLDRLDACASEDWCKLTPEELLFEHRLRESAPAALPHSLLTSLESCVVGTTFPENESKIVPFPTSEPVAERAKGGGWWSRAAAVAVVGALSAFFMPMHPKESTVVNQTPVESAPIPGSRKPQEWVPASFNSGLSQTSDEGVIWHPRNGPQQVLKVIYLDQVTLKDGQGRTYQVELPRTEYILVPAKTD